jgi:hypothetical protein
LDSAWPSGAVVSTSVLKPGDGVVMDNLSSHKVDGVRESIEKIGAELLYLPPTSPDLNPLKRPGPSVVTFALHQEGKQLEPDRPGLGYVDIFSSDGQLLQRLEHGDWVNAPYPKTA